MKVTKIHLSVPRNGQIVEIPSFSAIYTSEKPIFSSRKEELLDEISSRNYGLFDGFLVGEHDGLEHFQLGQRKGINVGGKNAPLYVIGINEEHNQLFVGEGENHPGLWTSIIYFTDSHVLRDLNSLKEQWEIGIEVMINSAVLKEKVHAILYVFEERIIIEFGSPVSIAIREHALEIHLKGIPPLKITIIN